MAISEKAKEKFDEASKEIRDAIDSLKDEVKELTSKVREKLKGSGEEMRESAEELTREVKSLSQKVKDLVPKRRKKGQVPVGVNKFQELTPGAWERPIFELRRATDRLFDDFFRGMGWPQTEWKSPLGLSTDILGIGWPCVDMSETDEEIRIIAELPGVNKDDIDVSVTDDRIIIRGEKREEEEEIRRNYHSLERSYGSFHRSFSIPCEVESDKVDASFKDGVLTVKLPKSAAARERIRKIPITT